METPFMVSPSTEFILGTAEGLRTCLSYQNGASEKGAGGNLRTVSC